MTHDETLARLDDWAGDELPPRERAEVERHLEGCPPCRAEAEALRALLHRAAELPRGIAPPHDLWAGIAARIAPTGEDGGGGEGGAKVIPFVPRREGPRVPRWLLQAAAALLLALGSSGLTAAWMARRQAVVPASAEQAGASGAVPASLAAFSPAEAEYQQAVRDLEVILAARRARLAPETLATLEKNLRIIDEAIGQSRAALAADPASPELAGMLSDAYGAKVQALRRVVSL